MLSPMQAWRQLCARTGGTIAPSAFYRCISDGKLYSVRMGFKIFIPIAAMEDFIQRCLDGEGW